MEMVAAGLGGLMTVHDYWQKLGMVISTTCTLLVFMPACHYKLWDLKLHNQQAEILTSLRLATNSTIDISMPDLYPDWPSVQAKFIVPNQENFEIEFFKRQLDTELLRLTLDQVIVSITATYKDVNGTFHEKASGIALLSLKTSLHVNDYLRSYDNAVIVSLANGQNSSETHLVVDVMMAVDEPSTSFPKEYVQEIQAQLEHIASSEFLAEISAVLNDRPRRRKPTNRSLLV